MSHAIDRKRAREVLERWPMATPEHDRLRVALSQEPSVQVTDERLAIYEQALEAIRGPMDDPSGLDWRMHVYRNAGGGYEGLQAIAAAALSAREGGTE